VAILTTSHFLLLTSHLGRDAARSTNLQFA
jgi:hypothetical protein